MSYKLLLAVLLLSLISPFFKYNFLTNSTDSVSEFHAEAPHATASEGLAEGPNVVARAGFEPMTLRTKDGESTNKPPRLTKLIFCFKYADV